MMVVKNSTVIPGRAQREPGIHNLRARVQHQTPSLHKRYHRGYGFRVCAFGASRNDQKVDS